MDLKCSNSVVEPSAAWTRCWVTAHQQLQGPKVQTYSIRVMRRMKIKLSSISQLQLRWQSVNVITLRTIKSSSHSCGFCNYCIRFLGFLSRFLLHRKKISRKWILRLIVVRGAAAQKLQRTLKHRLEQNKIQNKNKAFFWHLYRTTQICMCMNETSAKAGRLFSCRFKW